MSNLPIAIVGGGPAGGAVALGLKQLGYDVTVIADERPFTAVEGISDRVMQGLLGAGFKSALQVPSPPSMRHACWDGETREVNTERLVFRPALDLAILDDLRQQGIDVIEGRADQIQQSDGHYEISYTDQQGNNGQLIASFLVEARGRHAPAQGIKRTRGRETVSLLQAWEGAACEPGTSVESFEDGWAWMAANSRGQRYLQLTLDVVDTPFPAKAELDQFCYERWLKIDEAQRFLADAKPLYPVTARTSTPVLFETAVGDNWIRVGDAAMAVDPLSGNGIFQALSSALQAPAVINTLLKFPERTELAKDFYHERLHHLFMRFARIGRDFYRTETQWPKHSFWAKRSQWPDNEPAHAAHGSQPSTVETKPVVVNGEIQQANVVVTADQPLGIWHIEGVSLADVLNQFHTLPGTMTLNDKSQALAKQFNKPSEQLDTVLGWLRHHHLISK